MTPEPRMTGAREDRVIFNIVWTGSVFPYLRYFVASQIAHSAARFRFIANGCPTDQISLMDDFATRFPDRVVEVLEVSPDPQIVAHGVALDRVRTTRDDGDLFCLIDPDIKVNAPFVPELTDMLENGTAAVTSGKEVWSDDNLVPVGHVGVAGEHFFDRNGFVFGSPHLAFYDRARLDETAERWAIGFGSAGRDLSEDAHARLIEMGHDYIVYDTGKIVNAFLQADGNGVIHRDLPHLVHIGGMSHYLSPPGGYITLENGEEAPDFARWGVNARFHVTKFTARTLQELLAGRPAPPIPDNADPAIAHKLSVVQREMTELVAIYAGN